MEKTDCFAYLKERKDRKKCYALNQLYCKNTECNFYQKKSDKINIEAIEKSVKEYEQRMNKKERKSNDRQTQES